MSPELLNTRRVMAVLQLALLLVLAACGASGNRTGQPVVASDTTAEPARKPTPTLAPETVISIVNSLQNTIRMSPATALDDFNTSRLATEFIINGGTASVVVSGSNSDVYFSDNGLKTFLFLQSPSGVDLMRMLGETDSELQSILQQGSAVGFYGDLTIDQGNTLYSANYRFDTQQAVTDAGTTYQTTVYTNGVPLVGFAFAPGEGYDQPGGEFQPLTYYNFGPSTQN